MKLLTLTTAGAHYDMAPLSAAADGTPMQELRVFDERHHLLLRVTLHWPKHRPEDCPVVLQAAPREAGPHD